VIHWPCVKIVFETLLDAAATAPRKLQGLYPDLICLSTQFAVTALSDASVFTPSGIIG
jgi:hypothetical protein